MSFRNFKALTFDVVGTLIDFEQGMLTHIRKVGGDAAARHSDDDILAIYRRSRADKSSGLYPDDLVRCYKDIAAELGLPDAPGAAEGLKDSVKDWPAFPDSVEALKRLRRHFRLVAMTNARRWALDHMATTLGQPFDTASQSMTCGSRSPIRSSSPSPEAPEPVGHRAREHPPRGPKPVPRHRRRQAPRLHRHLDRAAQEPKGLRRHPGGCRN